MPEYVFRDQKERPLILPAGDYILEVAKCEFGISKGKVTAGADTLELTVKAVETGNTFFETLTFHEATDWKIDCFLKSCNAAPAKGQRVNFTEEFLVGLRGWATVGQRSYTKEGRERTVNEVVSWITNKEKLPRAAAASQDDEDTSF